MKPASVNVLFLLNVLHIFSGNVEDAAKFSGTSQNWVSERGGQVSI